MRIFRTLAEAPADFGPSALTIGNFDGVHRGHRAILRRLVSIAAERRLTASVLTFDPHPTRVVAPARAPRLLTTPEERASLMREEGIEQVLILPFTPEVASLRAEDFVKDLVVARLGARAVLVGDSFRFGKGQKGNTELLAALGAEYGFVTEIVPAVRYRGQTVSSSGIRDLLLSGRVSAAARWLERAYGLEGHVVHGRGVGSKTTVPTLNLATMAEIIPARGVYVTRTSEAGSSRSWNSITNIGYRPTFGASDALTIETFLLDPLEGSSPSHIRVDFLRRVRDERQFPSPEALRVQILRDVGAAQRYFRRAKTWIGQVPCISS
jgi:riboflavin kinase/FMN adenylyltransferase